MKQAELKKLTQFWTGVLRLRDWDISVRLDPHDGEDYVGMNAVNLQRKYCRIVLKDKPDEDLEHTLVHELIHIHFAPFFSTDEGLVNALQEQAIDGLATSLMALKRKLDEQDS